MSFNDYLLALLRWMYEVYGGNPEDLRKGSITATALRVQTLYLNPNQNPNLSESTLLELTASAREIDQIISNPPSTLTLGEVAALESVSIAVWSALSRYGE